MSTTPSPNTKTADAETDIGQQIDALRADLARLTSTLSDDMTRSVENAGHRIGQAGRDARTNATSAVIDHPLTAIGIAAGIGLLLGLVARKA